jgi:hypothetical protein
MRHRVRHRRMNNCFENSDSLGARVSSPAGVFKNRAINNNAREEAVGIGQILRAGRLMPHTFYRKQQLSCFEQYCVPLGRGEFSPALQCRV